MADASRSSPHSRRLPCMAATPRRRPHARGKTPSRMKPAHGTSWEAGGDTRAKVGESAACLCLSRRGQFSGDNIFYQEYLGAHTRGCGGSHAGMVQASWSWRSGGMRADAIPQQGGLRALHDGLGSAHRDSLVHRLKSADASADRVREAVFLCMMMEPAPALSLWASGGRTRSPMGFIPRQKNGFWAILDGHIFRGGSIPLLTFT